MKEVPLARRVMEMHVEHVDVAANWLGFLCNLSVNALNKVRSQCILSGSTLCNGWCAACRCSIVASTCR